MAYKQLLTLTQESQDVIANQSKVRLLWQSQQTDNSQNYVDHTAYYWVSFNGGEEKKYSVVYELPANTTQTILDTVITVPHDELGNGHIKVRIEITPVSVTTTATEELTLDTIARASSVVASNADIGAVATIIVGRKNDAFSHSIHYQFGDLERYIASDTGDLSKTEVKLTATSIGFPIPEEFYSQIQDSPSGQCKIVCCTYSGDKKIGEEQTTEFTVTANKEKCRPTISATVVDINDTTTLTGNENVLINGFSTACCLVDAEAKNGATIKELWFNGSKMEGVIAEIANTETSEYTFRVIDSRGYDQTFSVSKTESGEWISYVKLTCNASVKRTDPTSGKGQLHIEGKYFNGSFGEKRNELSLQYRVNNGEYQTLNPVIGDSGYTVDTEIDGLEYTRVNTVEVLAKDALMTVVGSCSVQKGIPVFDWGENDFAFHVPVTAPSFNGVSNSLLSAYPVGSVYISTNETSPADLFGGRWERLKDRFLLAAGDTYEAGSAGGEAEHELTIEEMPSHSHTVPAWVETVSGDGAFDYFRNNASDHTIGTFEAGGGQPHNNMPPYIAVYMWVRLADETNEEE